jgi:hypothetical protein
MTPHQPVDLEGVIKRIGQEFDGEVTLLDSELHALCEALKEAIENFEMIAAENKKVRSSFGTMEYWCDQEIMSRDLAWRALAKISAKVKVGE